MLEEIRNALLKHSSKEIPNKVPNKVPNKSEVAVLRLLAAKPILTRAELAKQIGLTDSGVKKILYNLKANGWIEREGSNKSGRWIIKFEFDEN